jgi:CRP-like cAMP-binding protein
LQEKELSLLRKALSEIAIVPDEAWMKLLPHLKVCGFKAKSHLAETGARPTEMWFIVSGFVRVFFSESNGNEYTKAFRVPGDIAAPYSSLILKTPSKVSIQACVDTSTVAIPYGVIEKLYGENPIWNHLGRRFAEIIFLEREQREWELLTMNAKERHEKFLESYGSIRGDLTQNQIASYLGISPVSLSRLLSQERT